jgi:protein-tyrosine phosphatase
MAVNLPSADPLPPASDPSARRALAVRARQAWSEADSLAFVCLGNICRSPFAERLALRRLSLPRRVTSAGYYPEPGRRSPRSAIAAARRYGVDLGSHRSRVLTPAMLEQADAVFVCDRQNYRAIVAQHPRAGERVHFLGALFEHGPLTITDPFGGSAAEYELVYRQIADAVEAAVS